MEGIQELKEIVAAALALGEALVASKEDGKIDFFDLPKFMKVLVKFREAIQGAEKVPAELKGMTPEEMQELLDACVEVVMVYAKLFVVPTAK